MDVTSQAEKMKQRSKKKRTVSYAEFDAFRQTNLTQAKISLPAVQEKAIQLGKARTSCI